MVANRWGSSENVKIDIKNNMGHGISKRSVQSIFIFFSVTISPRYSIKRSIKRSVLVSLRASRQ